MIYSVEFVFFVLMMIPFVLIQFLFSRKDALCFFEFKSSVWSEFSGAEKTPSADDIDKKKLSFINEKKRINSSIVARALIILCISLPLVMSFYNFQMTIVCGSASCLTTPEYSGYAVISTLIVSCCLFVLFLLGLTPSIKRSMLIDSMLDSYFLKSSDCDWGWMMDNGDVVQYFNKIRGSGRTPITLELYIASNMYHSTKNNT